MSSNWLDVSSYGVGTNWADYKLAKAKTIGNTDDTIDNKAKLKAFFKFSNTKTNLFDTATKSIYGDKYSLNERVVRFLLEADRGKVEGNLHNGDLPDYKITTAQRDAIFASWANGQYEVDVTNLDAPVTKPADPVAIEPATKTKTTTPAAPPKKSGVTNGTLHTVAKGETYEKIAAYILSEKYILAGETENLSHEDKIKALEAKLKTYNAANKPELTLEVYIAKMVRQVTVASNKGKKANYPDPNDVIDLAAVVNGNLDKTKDDVQEAIKAKKTATPKVVEKKTETLAPKPEADKPAVEETKETDKPAEDTPAKEEDVVPTDPFSSIVAFVTKPSNKMLLFLGLAGAAVFSLFKSKQQQPQQLPIEQRFYNDAFRGGMA